SGNTVPPVWNRPVGSEKQVSLMKRCDPLTVPGSQLRTGRSAIDGVPKIVADERFWPFASLAPLTSRLKLPPVFAVRFTPLWICVTPESCQPLSTPFAIRDPLL